MFKLDTTTFVSIEKQLDFILTKTEGRIRMNLLGITRSMYGNKELADAWYNDLAQYEMRDLARENLDNIYMLMQD